MNAATKLSSIFGPSKRYEESLIGEVARVMEYKTAYDLYRNDIEYAVT